MGFKKGSIKPANSGRKKGSVNKISLEVVKAIQMISIDALSELREDIKLMNKFQKWQVMIGIMKYGFDTFKTIESTSTSDSKVEIVITYDEETPPLNIDHLNIDQVNNRKRIS